MPMLWYLFSSGNSKLSNYAARNLDTINESYPSSITNTAPTSPPHFRKNENQGSGNGSSSISKNATLILLSSGKYASIIPTLENSGALNNNNNGTDNINDNYDNQNREEKNQTKNNDIFIKSADINSDGNNNNFTIIGNSKPTNDDYDNDSVTYTNTETQVYHERECTDLPPKYLHTAINTTYDTLESVPKSPILGRSRSFSTGTGTGGTSNIFDSSISSSSSGFFSSLFATPSKHYRKRYGGENDDDRVAQCRKDNMLYRVGDEEYLTKHDNNHNNSNYPNTHFFSERNIRKSEKECHKKNQKEKLRLQEKERDQEKRRENEEQYDNDQNDDENNNDNHLIKSRLCLQISVKSSSKYRLCDSNPQEEGDSNWAIITGIYQQNFILRGDDCDFEEKLVSSDGLVNIIVDREKV